jgi:DNA-binding IclR family transcriptional regulator
VRHTERTIVDPAELAQVADATRARGYATEDEEFQDGVRAVAAPVFVDGDVIAALGASGPDLDIEVRAQHVVGVAAELTAALGSHPYQAVD